MFRNLIATFAVIGLIAGQLAAVPHAHGSADASPHSATPHVHLSWFHSHSHGEHSHFHGNPADCDSSSPVDTVQTGGEQHPADAVYLTAITALIHSMDQGSDGLTLQTAKILETTIPPFLVGAVFDRRFKVDGPVRDHRAPHCALYLALRALRI